MTERSFLERVRTVPRFPIRLVVAAMLGLFAVSVIGILWTHRVTTESEVIGGMRSILANVSDGTVARSDAFLREIQDDVALTSQLLESGTLEFGPQLEDYFGSVLRNSPNASGIFYGTADGEFLFVNRDDQGGPAGFRTKTISLEDGARIVDLVFRDADFEIQSSAVDPEDTYDPTVRPWYSAAVAAGGDLVITDPYVFYTSQEPGVTTALPVFDLEGDIAGVVGVDVSLSQLSSFLRELRLGPSGTAFIVNRSGEVIALEDQSELRQPDGGGFRLSTIREVSDPLVAQSFNQAIDEALGTEARFFSVKGGPSTDHVFVVPIGVSDWVLGVALSESDFLAEIRQNQLNNTLIISGIAALSLFLAWLLIRNITRPLSELRERAAQIEAGTFERRAPLQTRITELQQTSDAFDHMVIGLKNQQEQDQRLLAAMEERIKERKQSQELKRANQALQQFAYMASHDLRAPIKRMVNLADLAVMDSDGASRELVQPMRESAIRLEELVLGYGRLAGLERGEPQDKCVSTLVQQAQEQSSCGVDIDLRDDAVVTCDPVLITQVLVNLLENASKYGASDDVMIKTADDGAIVTISVSNPVEKTFKVDDSVFAPFRRLVDDDAGSGLGLAIVERIAHLHGGSVTAQCVDDTFTIEFSLAKEGQK